MRILQTLLPAVAALAAGAAVSTAAHAQAPAPTATVAYADLDLATPSGRTELNARIDRASRALCTPDSLTGSRIPTPDRDCLVAMRKQIAGQIDAKRKRALAAAENPEAAHN